MYIETETGKDEAETQAEVRMAAPCTGAGALGRADLCSKAGVPDLGIRNSCEGQVWQDPLRTSWGLSPTSLWDTALGGSTEHFTWYQWPVNPWTRCGSRLTTHPHHAWVQTPGRGTREGAGFVCTWGGLASLWVSAWVPSKNSEQNCRKD